jgi:hypothetical protein
MGPLEPFGAAGFWPWDQEWPDADLDATLSGLAQVLHLGHTGYSVAVARPMWPLWPLWQRYLQAQREGRDGQDICTDLAKRIQTTGIPLMVAHRLWQHWQRALDAQRLTEEQVWCVWCMVGDSRGHDVGCRTWGLRQVGCCPANHSCV